MLKEHTNRLTELTSQLLNESNTKKLQGLSKNIENCISDLLIESDNKFTPILVTRFLKPLSHHIRQIEDNPIPNSRSKKEQRQQQLQVLKLAYSLRNSVLKDYQDQLNNTDYFQDYIIEKGAERDFIITPDYKSLPIEVIPTNTFKTLLLNTYTETLSYFKKQTQTKPQNYRDELYLFVDETKAEITKLNSLIIKQTLIVNELQREVENEKDYLQDVLFDRQQELTNHKIHKETLEKLLEQLYQSYYFLKTYEENRVIPLTVFGHRNYDAMQWFYQELKDFLENSTSYNHIIEVFSLENRNPISKIELVNGTLNDYAHLINELEPYFIEELRARSKYNQWWSDRFVFTTSGNFRIEKTKDAISTMRSNTRKDPSRKSSKRSKINQIVETITNIPQ